MTQELIRLTQLPVIEERLREIGPAWAQMAQDAASLVCNDDTLSTVRKERAALTKQFDELESQRKAIVARCMEPVRRFEETYKECITTPYKAADAALKGKIEQTTAVIVDDCEARLRAYFLELTAAHGVEWLRYEQAGIKIGLTAARQKTPRKLLDELAEFVARVSEDMEAIRRGEDAPEVTAEYKSNGLNLAAAIATVRRRKEAAEQERQAAEAGAETRARQEEAVERVEALAPPKVVEEPAPDPVFERFTFTCIRATRSQLIQIREFMKGIGVKYE